MPDVAIAAVLVNALDDGFDRIDLIRPHHQHFLFALDQYHVAADHVAERAFGEECLGEVVEVGDLAIVFGSELVDGQELFARVKAEVARVVVGKVPRIALVADDEQLNEAHQ